jgi:hypothetical protein
MNQIVLLALIQALTQEVNLLEQELAQLQNPIAATSTYIAPALDLAPSTSIGAGIGTEIPVATPVVEPVQQTITQPMTQEAISVTFAQSGDSEGLVTVKNTLGVPVRIKSLDVDGSLAGFTISETYGQGLVYQKSFRDATGKEFDVFTCEGLGSQGTANLGSGGMVDPCVRRDAHLAKNELQPNETMILRYTGNPTTVTYQEGSIVDLSGNDVEF